MPGWCCCDQWELWDKWDAEDHRVGPASLQRPDPPPAQPPERRRVVQRQRLPAAARRSRRRTSTCSRSWSGASRSCPTPPTRPGKLSGPTGVKMRGPYDYVPPSYWLTDTEERRRVRLRHRDGARRRGAADREPEEDAARRPAVADRRVLEVPRRGRRVQGPEPVHGRPRGPVRQGHQRRGLRAQGPGPRLREPSRDVRGLRRATSTPPPASSSGCSTTPGRR